MTKTKQWLYWLVMNTFEVSIIVLYLNGIKTPANILPVYLTVLLCISVLTVLGLFLILPVLSTDTEK